MFTKISSSLVRQEKALILLKTLMKEEFELLLENKVDEISPIEFSIHELLRQIANEKEDTIKNLGGGKVLDFAQMLPDDQRVTLEKNYRAVDLAEQQCAKQATLNSEVSLALLRQSDQLVKELTQAVTPKVQASYGNKGTYNKAVKSDAVLISGRL